MAKAVAPWIALEKVKLFLQCKETIAAKENLIKRLITPYVKAKVSEHVFEQISNNKFVQNKVVVREHIMDPNCVEVVNFMLVRKAGNE